MEFTVEQLAQLLQGEVEGNAGAKVSALSKIQEGHQGSISFLSNPKYESFVYDTQATAVIVSKDFAPKKPVAATLIRVADPYSAFSVILEEYDKFVSYRKTGVEEPSYIGQESTVGQDVYRGAFSYIGSKVSIGNNVKIYPHAYIGDGTTIGDNTIIYSGVKVYEGSRIGKGCVLQAGAVIGSEGFGFAPQPNGSYKAIPQVGNVILEDYVAIGANTTIDCATMGSTVVKEGAKLDNLIQVAHNVTVGKHTVIAAQTGISGSTTIGDHCTFGGQVGIAGHLNIANKIGVGAQAGIIRDLKTEGENLVGSPVVPVRDYFRSYAVFRKLPDLQDRVKQLEEKILNLARS